jgi:pyruvate formate lyase activating enzyme
LDFTVELLRGAKAADLHFAVETCGYANDGWIERLPIVPGLNDRPDHFAGIAALVRSLPRLVGVEIMPYHRLGSGKQQRLGLAEPLPNTPAPSPATVAGWAVSLRELGVTVVSQ